LPCCSPGGRCPPQSRRYDRDHPALTPPPCLSMSHQTSAGGIRPCPPFTGQS
jgi:hypothetical protein